MRLFQCPPGKPYENVLAMDLPFVLFIPFTRAGDDIVKVPPASLQLPSRVAETFYELVVSVQEGHRDLKKHAFPVPLCRYDTLSTFGMYNRPASQERISDHVVTLGTSLSRWSFGPNDPVEIFVRLTPNPDWMSKARRVSISRIVATIEEQVTFNPEGDEPTTKTNKLISKKEVISQKLPEKGYMATINLTFPAKDLRDGDGFLPRGKPAFPMHTVAGFTTTASLYKIEYFVSVKVCPQAFLGFPVPPPPPPRRSHVLIELFLFSSQGPYVQLQGHSSATANHSLAVRPPSLYGRDGCDRNGSQRCVPHQHGKPHASRPNDNTTKRSLRLALPRHDDGWQQTEVTNRMMHDEI